jgi:hypothetical protein
MSAVSEAMIPPALTPELATWLGGGVVIDVATRDAFLAPELVNGMGLRVDAGVLTVLLPESLSSRTVANARANGEVAVVVVQPTTEKSVQLKGKLIELRSPGPEDLALQAAYLASLVHELAYVGVPPSLTRRIGRGPVVVLRMRVRDVFDATPGPNAGRRLAS